MYNLTRIEYKPPDTVFQKPRKLDLKKYKPQEIPPCARFNTTKNIFLGKDLIIDEKSERGSIL